MYKDMYNELSKELAVSAREYFMVLRLAIYHINGYFAETSVDVMQALQGDGHSEIYKKGCDILRVLNGKEIK